MKGELLEDFVSYHTGKLQNRMKIRAEKSARGEWNDPMEAKKAAGRYLGLEEAGKLLQENLKEFRRLIDEN